MNVESAEVALAYTYAWWLTGSEQAARSAVLAAVGRPDVPGADPQLRIEILLRRVRAAAVSAPTMCPASELALLHDAIGIGLDSAAGLAHIDAREARTELAHGRLEALGPEAQFEITHPERLGGLAVGNPADVAAARQNESLQHLREMILTGRDELIDLAQIDVPPDLLDTVARQQRPAGSGSDGTSSGRVESEPLEAGWFEGAEDVASEDPSDGLDVDARPDSDGETDGDPGSDDDGELGSSDEPGADSTDEVGDDVEVDDVQDPATDMAEGPGADLEDDLDEPYEDDDDDLHEDHDGGDDAYDDDGYDDDAYEYEESGDEVGERNEEEIDFTGVTDAPELGTPGVPPRRTPWGWIAVLVLIAVLVGLYLWRTSNNTNLEADGPVADSVASADPVNSEPAVADEPSDQAAAAVDQNGSEQPAATGADASEGAPTATEGAPLSDFVLTRAGIAVGIGSDPDFDNPVADPFDPISVTIEYEGAEADDALIAEWTVDGDSFGTERADLSPGLDTTRFTRQVPQDGWPSGQHTLELTLERTGEVVGAAQFEVEGGATLEEQQASEAADVG